MRARKLVYHECREFEGRQIGGPPGISRSDSKGNHVILGHLSLGFWYILPCLLHESTLNLRCLARLRVLVERVINNGCMVPKR
jgi:hypothetical protein